MIISNGFVAGIVTTLFVEIVLFVFFVISCSVKNVNKNYEEEMMKDEFVKALLKALEDTKEGEE